MAAPGPWLYVLEAKPHFDTGGGSLEERSVKFFSGPWDGLMLGGVKAHVGLSQALSVSVDVDHPLLGGASSRSSSFGQIGIRWGDGSRDALFRPPYYWRGRAVTVSRIRKPDSGLPDFALFTPVFSGVIEDLSYDVRGVSIVVRDAMLQLEQRLQRRVYAGTGNGALYAEGAGDLKDVPIPIMLGRCLNVAPVPVDRATNLYQWHDGRFSPAYEVTGVFDRGVAYTPCDDGLGGGFDFADLASLLAWTPVPSEYATCLSLGYLRLGNTPAGIVTIDAGGDAGDPDVPGFSDLWYHLIRRVAKGYAGLGASQIGALPSLPYNVGFYTGTQPALMSDVVRRLAESALGGAVFDRLGVLRVLTYLFGAVSPVATIYAHQIDRLQVDRTPMPGDPLRVGYARSWTVQDDLAAGVPAARKSLVGSAFRYVQLSTGAANYFPEAKARTFESLLTNQTDASAVALTAVGAQEAGWRRASLVCRGHQLARDVGQWVTVVHPRLGFASGRDALVLGVTEDLSRDDRCSLRLLVPG